MMKGKRSTERRRPLRCVMTPYQAVETVLNTEALLLAGDELVRELRARRLFPATPQVAAA